MSANRENITWQSPDGSWNRGFYEFRYVNEDSPDFDFEWNVEHGNNFCWVAIGLPDEQACLDAWDEANSGGSMTVPYGPENAGMIARLDEKVAEVVRSLQPNTGLYAGDIKTCGYV